MSSNRSNEAEASAPASAANLGPGFDVLALALELRCHVEARPARAWSIRHKGPEMPTEDDRDLVLEAARKAAGTARPLALDVQNDIPIARGLGASAAASAAGSAAAWRATGGSADPDEIFRLVSEIEGHSDNAAAAVFGGLVAVSAGGRPIRLEIADGLMAVLAVPHQRLSTTEARRVLPESVERSSVVRNVTRTVSLVEGLRRGDPDLLRGASGDELHEPFRQQLFPEGRLLREAAERAGAVFSCWSGAGPSVLALVTDEVRIPVIHALQEGLGKGGRVLTPSISFDGIR